MHSEPFVVHFCLFVSQSPQEEVIGSAISTNQRRKQQINKQPNQSTLTSYLLFVKTEGLPTAFNKTMKVRYSLLHFLFKYESQPDLCFEAVISQFAYYLCSHLNQIASIFVFLTLLKYSATVVSFCWASSAVIQ